MLDVKPKTTGGFYREDAARLASEAARVPKPAEPPAAAPAIAVPSVESDAPRRPRLAPKPASNQNVRAPRAESYGEPDAPRGWTAGRVFAWVLLAPWYAATAIGALGIDVLFVKDLLGL